MNRKYYSLGVKPETQPRPCDAASKCARVADTAPVRGRMRRAPLVAAVNVNLRVMYCCERAMPSGRPASAIDRSYPTVKWDWITAGYCVDREFGGLTDLVRDQTCVSRMPASFRRFCARAPMRNRTRPKNIFVRKFLKNGE